MCLWKCPHYFVVIAPTITKVVLYANDNDQKKHTPLPTQKGCQRAAHISCDFRGTCETDLSVLADLTHRQVALKEVPSPTRFFNDLLGEEDSTAHDQEQPSWIFNGHLNGAATLQSS